MNEEKHTVIGASIGTVKEEYAAEACIKQGIYLGVFQKCIDGLDERPLATLALTAKTFEKLLVIVEQQQMQINTLMIKQGLMKEEDLHDKERVEFVMRNIGMEGRFETEEEAVENVMKDAEEILRKDDKHEDNNDK